jgi:methylated-DNA-[protein]-cysteine S-methyltransferase
MVVHYQEDVFIGEVRESPGPLTFAVDAEGRLLWLQFLDGDYPKAISGEMERQGFGPRVDAGQGDRVRQEILDYCHGQRRAFSIPLRLLGTAWQHEVWQALTRIPFGEKRTYGQVAASLGRPKAARAMGRANATNPISLVVPCHRVIGSNGNLTGYGGGLHIKERLLEHERRVLQEFAG